MINVSTITNIVILLFVKDQTPDGNIGVPHDVREFCLNNALETKTCSIRK